LTGEANHAQPQGRTGQLVHQPGHGYLLNPGANDGHALTEEIEAEVAVCQGAPGRGRFHEWLIPLGAWRVKIRSGNEAWKRWAGPGRTRLGRDGTRILAIRSDSGMGSHVSGSTA